MPICMTPPRREPSLVNHSHALMFAEFALRVHAPPQIIERDY